MSLDISKVDSEIKDREREFHDRRFSAPIDPRSSLSKYYSVTGESTAFYRSLIERYAHKGATVLEYGCGDGTGKIDFYKSLNCTFYGIDISSEAIKKAQITAESEGFPANYSVEDAESTGLPPNFFDLIIGSGIVHHLNVTKSMRELHRVAKSTGSCVFFEPLGHNVFINAFRLLTPKFRSSDEHPLRESDFRIMARYFRKVDVSYFHFFSLGAVLFRRIGLFEIALSLLSRLDRYLVREFEWFGKYCWICVIHLSEPISA